MIADKNYYRDKDGNLVEEGDPNAAFLVAGKGTEIPKSTVEKYGLDKVAPASEEATVADEAEEAPAAKSKKPAENKMKTPKSNKGKE